MTERLTTERLHELRRIRAFAVSFNGPEKAFILEELQSLVEEVLGAREYFRIMHEISRLSAEGREDGT